MTQAVAWLLKVSVLLTQQLICPDFAVARLLCVQTRVYSAANLARLYCRSSCLCPSVCADRLALSPTRRLVMQSLFSLLRCFSLCCPVSDLTSCLLNTWRFMLCACAIACKHYTIRSEVRGIFGNQAQCIMYSATHE